MSRVLVTGGTGMLGRVLVPALAAAGHDVKVLSRHVQHGVVSGDLRTGEGIAAAVAAVDVVVHAATSPFRRTRAVDVEGTERLLQACADADVGHFIFPSIVGVDRHPFRYYRAKWEAEQVVEAGPVRWTIARATQFHDLLDQVLHRAVHLPAVPIPRGFVFQPVDTAEYASVLVDLVAAGPAGRAPDTGGPEVLPLRDLARAWLSARGRRRPLVAVPAPGRTARAFRQGVHTCPERTVGTVTWEQYLSH